MKHLEGPWTVEYTGVSTLDDFNIETATIRAGHLVVAEVECHHASIASVEANARLIAAAPELAQATRDLLKAFRVCIGIDAFMEFEQSNPAVRAAKLVLDKVRS